MVNSFYLVMQPDPSAVPLYQHLGCYGNSKPRALPKTLFTSSVLTPEMCGAHAFSKGYAYFGIESGKSELAQMHVNEMK